MRDCELLHQQVVSEQGSFQRVKRWWSGIHPDMGAITRGWTGWETVEEKDRVMPLHVVAVGEIVTANL